MRRIDKRVKNSKSFPSLPPPNVNNPEEETALKFSDIQPEAQLLCSLAISLPTKQPQRTFGGPLFPNRASFLCIYSRPSTSPGEMESRYGTVVQRRERASPRKWSSRQRLSVRWEREEIGNFFARGLGRIRVCSMYIPGVIINITQREQEPPRISEVQGPIARLSASFYRLVKRSSFSARGNHFALNAVYLTSRAIDYFLYLLSLSLLMSSPLACNVALSPYNYRGWKFVFYEPGTSWYHPCVMDKEMCMYKNVTAGSSGRGIARVYALSLFNFLPIMNVVSSVQLPLYSRAAEYRVINIYTRKSDIQSYLIFSWQVFTRYWIHIAQSNQLFVSAETESALCQCTMQSLLPTPIIYWFT